MLFDLLLALAPKFLLTLLFNLLLALTLKLLLALLLQLQLQLLVTLLFDLPLPLLLLVDLGLRSRLTESLRRWNQRGDLLRGWGCGRMSVAGLSCGWFSG